MRADGPISPTLDRTGIRPTTAGQLPSGRHARAARTIAFARTIGFRGARQLENPAVWIATITALLSVQLALIFTHRPWLDEWQALQIAVQSPNLASLFENLHYEGHPPLWYLLLRGASAIVGPAWALAAVQALVAVALQLTILLRSPFARIHRLLIASSFFVLFDYATLSRSLGLGVLFVTLAVAFRRRKIGWMAIALMPMADFLFGILSLSCAMIRWRERSLWWPGIAIWIASGLLALWTVWPAPDIDPAFQTTSLLFDLGTYLVRLSVLLVPLHTAHGMLEWNHPLPLALAVIAGPLFLYFGDRQLKRDRLNQLLFRGFVAVTLVVSIMLYPLAIRHLSLIAWLLILLKWRECDAGAELDRPFRIWLGTIAICGLLVAGLNMVKPFDTAAKAAAFIRAHHLTRAHWIAFPDSRGQGVSALTGMEFERLTSNCTESFIRWNHTSVGSPTDLIRALRGLSDRDGRLYLLSDFDMSFIHPPLVQPLATIPAGYDGQTYRLYVIRPDLPARSFTVPQCPPRRRPLNLGQSRH